MYNKTSGSASQEGSLGQLEKHPLSGIYFENRVKHKNTLW
jgi:hypothetical protein